MLCHPCLCSFQALSRISFIDTPSPLQHCHTIPSTLIPQPYAWRHVVYKPLKLVLTPDSQLNLHPSTNYSSAHSLCLTQMTGRKGGYVCGGEWESTASCIPLLNKESLLQPLVPDEFAQVLPTFTEMIPSNIPRELTRHGQIRYSLCFPNVQFLCNCTTLFLILTLVFFFPMASLQGCILYLMCVFFLKRWLHLCIVGAFVRLIWLDLSVCLHFRLEVIPALLLIMMAHQKHCLLFWRVTTQL